jgi:hypothetical protein
MPWLVCRMRILWVWCVFYCQTAKYHGLIHYIILYYLKITFISILNFLNATCSSMATDHHFFSAACTLDDGRLRRNIKCWNNTRDERFWSVTFNTRRSRTRTVRSASVRMSGTLCLTHKSNCNTCVQHMLLLFYFKYVHRNTHKLKKRGYVGLSVICSNFFHAYVCIYEYGKIGEFIINNFKFQQIQYPPQRKEDNSISCFTIIWRHSSLSYPLSTQIYK